MFADALAVGIPVLVGLNSLNAAAFQTFAAGLAVELPPEQEELHQWALSCLAWQMEPTEGRPRRGERLRLGFPQDR